MIKSEEIKLLHKIIMGFDFGERDVTEFMGNNEANNRGEMIVMSELFDLVYSGSFRQYGVERNDN